ncbi:GNAT family N-acetyltransferase [Roseisolibacter sp. H3M3-2]|uniref:GNAT family N-acetyltransferase n=1 Tax=Roseisolibacter sp. H3M3-2 TaxID=3031323 RepID=UPI0023DA5CDB|nr:GNAT family N-acetyltransferase [Roseisolibacter sp. H3M3-2]MDF1502423.1 GNAT family N-acetyltransferase [Roseisolibacter sp. H3M3-2]
MTTPTVTHDAGARRFVAETDDGPAVLAYESVGRDVLDLQHTVVPHEERGRGVGEALVRAAVAHARAEGVRLIPTCPFVEAWRRRHPKDGDVFVDG